MPLLRLDRQGGDRPGFQAAQGDLLAGLLAIAVGLVFDTLQRGVDLGNQLALPVAGPQLERAFRFRRGAVGDVRLLAGIFLQSTDES